MKYLRPSAVILAGALLFCSSCFMGKPKTPVDKPEQAAGADVDPEQSFQSALQSGKQANERVKALGDTTVRRKKTHRRKRPFLSRLMPWRHPPAGTPGITGTSGWHIEMPTMSAMPPAAEQQTTTFATADELARKYAVSAEENKQTLQKIEAARQRHAPQDLLFLQEIAVGDNPLLAPVATEALGQFETAASERVLAGLVDSAPVTVKGPALAALIRLHSDYAKTPCLEELRRDKPTALYVLALQGVNKFGWREAVPLVRDRLAKAPPHMQLQMAQALLPWDVPQAELVLRTFALSGDPELAVVSMQALASRATGAEIIFKNLYADSDTIRNTALTILHNDAALRNSIRSMPESMSIRDLQWYEVLAYAVWGEGEFPQTAAQMASSGTALERKAAVSCLRRNSSGASVVGLIDAMMALEPSDRHGIHRLLVEKQAAMNLNPLPDVYAKLEDWQEWWFRQHFILAIRGNAALLLQPDKTELTVRVGYSLPWRSQIDEIHPGEGSSGTRGGYVELKTPFRVIRLQPLPEGLRQR